MPELSLQDLYGRLVEDEWRKKVDFSEDLSAAHAVLFYPFALDSDREKTLNLWLQRNQPCLFGRVAAGQRALHYCILTDEDLVKPDEYIRDQIREEIQAWKRRSVRPAPTISDVAHGFVLAVISPRVCLAEPNDTLRQFMEHLLELWGCAKSTEDHGRVYWEQLFLERPDNGELYGFTISIDSFAAQGDGRWWHDHRMPGGIAFTANSAGHMRRYREWYEVKPDQSEWLLTTAMGTIDLASCRFRKLCPE